MLGRVIVAIAAVPEIVVAGAVGAIVVAEATVAVDPFWIKLFESPALVKLPVIVTSPLLSELPPGTTLPNAEEGEFRLSVHEVETEVAEIVTAFPLITPPTLNVEGIFRSFRVASVVMFDPAIVVPVGDVK